MMIVPNVVSYVMEIRASEQCHRSRSTKTVKEGADGELGAK